jgi:nicotinate-nucleotide adenylyltransferase
MEKRSKTGLFFGSFDPVHIGHLIIAEYMYMHTELQKIWFVISPVNPHKTHQSRTDSQARLQMLQLALNDNQAFQLCDIELDMPQPNYTIHTLRKLKNKYPEKKFVLIIGSDNLEGFEKWKDYKEILEMTEIYVYPRNGKKVKSSLSQIQSVHIIDAPLLELSSTIIRQSFVNGLDTRYMLHEKVYRYIKENNLYQENQ